MCKLGEIYVYLRCVCVYIYIYICVCVCVCVSSSLTLGYMCNNRYSQQLKKKISQFILCFLFIHKDAAVNLVFKSLVNFISPVIKSYIGNSNIVFSIDGIILRVHFSLSVE